MRWLLLLPLLRILFVGNGLTAANELPALVEAIGKANGRRIDTVTIARPDYSLEDHWKDGEAQRILARGKGDFVVLQQGPSSRPESRASRREDRPLDGLAFLRPCPRLRRREALV
jgi:hypothetical protein